MSQQKNELAQLLSRPYKYGFRSDIEQKIIAKGLNEATIRSIANKKHEPSWLLNFRLRAYNMWSMMKEPKWAEVRYPNINYQSFSYYAEPKIKEKLKTLDEVDPDLLLTFEKLGIPLNEQKRLSNVAVDAVFDSVSVATTFKQELSDSGVIFCSLGEAINKHSDIVKKYLGSVVSMSDNYFASLNASVFSDGSFVCVPEGVSCPMDLSSYFRINSSETGQFERTVIIAKKRASVSYLEGCTAPAYSTNQLHAAVVELYAAEGSKIKYSTVQNWYSGNQFGEGGIYNFVTKRGICDGNYSKICWTQVETGSAITWKYPSVILKGTKSTGEFYSVALTNTKQQADTGTKMIHLGKNSRSRVTSKGISSGHSINCYRGLVSIRPSAEYARNYSQCDSLLIGNRAGANTYPYIVVHTQSSQVEHEASTSRIGDEQMFYFEQRGIESERAFSALVSGFCTDVFAELPLEFAAEVNQLITLKLEETVG